MPRRPLLIALAALLLGAASPAGAVVVEQLYTASAELPDKGAEARTEGFRTALERVLVRVSGSDQVLSNPDVEAMLESPARYVQQYRYEPIEGAEDGAAGASDGAAAGASDDAGAEAAEAADEPLRHRLVVTFTGPRVERALKERGVLVWGAQRPEILAWLAVDDGERRFLVSADGDTPAHAELVEVAERRGLPVLLPLLDSTDRRRVEFVDIKGGFFDAVRTASERYRAETLLVGYIERRRGRWLTDWHLLGIGDERQAWRGTGPDLRAAIESGVAGATERIASVLAGQGGTQTRVRVRVQGVSDLDGYARVSGYLESLVRVRNARVVAVDTEETVFELAVQGRVADLERAIRLGNTLERAPGTATGSGEDAGTGDRETGEDGTGTNGSGATGTGSGGAAAGGPAEAAGTAGGPPQPTAPELVYRLIG